MTHSLEHVQPGVAVVSPEGDLTLNEAPTVRQELEDLVGEGTNVVVVDLSRVTFIDSSGLGALISGMKAARHAGGQLRLARLPEVLRPAFEHTNLLRIFPHFDTVELACRGR